MEKVAMNRKRMTKDPKSGGMLRVCARARVKVRKRRRTGKANDGKRGEDRAHQVSARAVCSSGREREEVGRKREGREERRSRLTERARVQARKKSKATRNILHLEISMR